MPRMNQQTARGSVRCAVERCGKSKRAHSPEAKHVIDHPFGGFGGGLTDTVFPVCGSCQQTIAQGDTYRFWKPRYGAKIVRCTTCPAPSRSSLTGSEILAMAWDIADAEYSVDDVATPEAFEDLRDDVSGQITDIVDVIQEKLDNIEAGMGHTYVPVYEELEERRGLYEDWQQEVDSVDSDGFVGTDDGVCTECGQAADDHGDQDEDHDFEGWDADGALEALQDAISACPE